jgi:hypothetical protein
MKEPSLNELTSNILSALPQSVTIEELEVVAIKWGDKPFNPVDDFINSIAKDLRDSGTSETAIAKMKKVFNPKLSGCYREYLRSKITTAFNLCKTKSLVA